MWENFGKYVCGALLHSGCVVRLDSGGMESSQEKVAVVETSDDERLDQDLCCV